MKKLWACALLSLVLLVCDANLLTAMPSKYNPNDGYHQYMKWINLARTAVNSKYPQADVVDFLYIGCSAQSEIKSQYTYKFWVRDSGREFGVYVAIGTNKKSGKAEVSKIEETDVVIPSYGKWRHAANEIVKEKYPEARIVDYHPYGCNWIENNLATQVFSFWLENSDNSSDFILLTIHYNIKTEELLSVDIKNRVLGK